MSADGTGIPESVFIHNYLHLAGVVVLYYDFFLTFGEEYWRVWKNPRTVSSILFFLNRYIPILGDIAVNTGNFHIFPNEHVHPICRQYAFFRQLLLIINQVVVCFILFLRTYALYGRDKRILVLVIGVGAALLGISCWSIVGQHQSVELRGGCHLEAEHMTYVLCLTLTSWTQGLAVSWESLFAFDCMVFGLTVYKTFRERYRHRISSGRHDIISLILRDGEFIPASFTLVMASVNFANTLTFYFLEPLLRGCLSTFASSVSVTMMSRLMLNLHGSALGRDVSDTSSGYPSTSENVTPMFFTSRISMPAAGLTTFATTQFDLDARPGERDHGYGYGYEYERDRDRGKRQRESVYVRDVPSARGGGYIEEVYELQEMPYRGGGVRDASAVRVRAHDDVDEDEGGHHGILHV
ncbi:hypothetical protein GY45DRAFT_1237531 [Cubamyces sp. BRFM 1775]|nr:hypothetical protein GY45DRAFT_1237531 [Cubamyces sp. BRFM 1775]